MNPDASLSNSECRYCDYKTKHTVSLPSNNSTNFLPLEAFSIAFENRRRVQPLVGVGIAVGIGS